MKQNLLVDTDILIDVSRGMPNAINRLKLEANTSTLAISSINLSCQLKRKLRSQKSKHEKEKQLSDCLRS